MDTLNDLRIIIIDDNEAIHQDFIKTLSFAESGKASELEKKLFSSILAEDKPALPHFHIDTALQGEEGVELIKKAFNLGNPYALAFVDIRMPPGWDGITTIKHLWEIDPEVQVVICTAYSDYSWEETIEQLGQKENLLILKKPFDSIAVRQLALALTKKWQLLQEKSNYTKILEERVEERTNSLQESLSVSRGTLESSADGILVLNNDNIIVDYNTKLLEMYNIPESIISTTQGDGIMNYISQQVEDPEAFLLMVSQLSKNTDIIKIDKYQFTNESIIECYTQPYMLKKKIAGRVWSFRDITQRILLEKKLEYQAMHDSLTGLPNRALMMDRLYQVHAKAKRENTLFAVIFFDLDRFKLINDSLGHAAGDELLKLVAKRLEFKLRKNDTLARLGGDEFVIIIDDVKDELNAGILANHLIDLFKNTFEISGHELSVTTSAGISIYPRDGETIGELLRNADAAMYKAKNLGSNQFQFYTAELGEQITDRLLLENELHQALLKNEFVLYYQPQIDTTTKKITSLEALIRWNHPTRGFLLPIHFIQVAEDSGLIIPIGDWILKTACEQNKKWLDAGFPPVRIAINMCTKQINQPDLVQKIKNTLDATGLTPDSLELEIVENVMINTLEKSNHSIVELSKMGVHITLDDFGTGNSSINYLRKLPLNRLKIDQSFVQNINLNTSDEIIVQSIIMLAQKLNLDVVAEGVETQKQLEFLKSNQCEDVQGFFFSEAVSSNEIEKLFKDTTK